eukprot:s3229_g9.t1
MVQLAEDSVQNHVLRKRRNVHIPEEDSEEEPPEMPRTLSTDEESDESGEEHLYRSDHDSDYGDLDVLNGRALRGGPQKVQLSRRVEKLVLDLKEKQELFKRRRRDLAKNLAQSNLARGIRKEFLQQQQRIVFRSKQMAKKLQSGRSRAWRHKWVFALVQMDMAVTAFWMGASPQTFYLYYTAQMAVVMSSKACDYRFTEKHYFLLDFCFFANLCTVLWLWVFPTSGYLFNAIESFCGLLAISVVAFRNSCVPHDFARISNAYVHYPQFLLVLSVKWSCEESQCLGMAKGREEKWFVRFWQAWSIYMIWAVVYSSVIFGFARKRIERKQRETLYGYFADQLGFKDKLPRLLRPHSGMMFMIGHLTLFLAGVGFIWIPFPLQVVAALLAIVIFFHNGGRFYVDHFWKAHERNTVLYVDAASSMMLSLPDGRALVRSSDSRAAGDSEEFLPIADGFRMIVLANRPGFPFLGNDFYRVCGDVFDCHAVEYLDKESELELLRQTAPLVPQEKLAALSDLFLDLRKLSDAGHLSYPYSTRDLLKLAAHAQHFPGDSSEELAANVFGFDAYQEDQRDRLLKALRRHGFAKGKAGEAELFGESRGRKHLRLVRR